MGTIEVMRKALEALENSHKFLRIEVNRAIGNDCADATIRETEAAERRHAESIAALRAELERLETVEPAATRTGTPAKQPSGSPST